MGKDAARKRELEKAIRLCDRSIRCYSRILSKMQDHLDFGNRNGRVIVTQEQVDAEAQALRDLRIRRRALELMDS